MAETLPLYAELVGEQFAQCAGISVTGLSPVLALCRKLVAAGHDPALPLEAYRGDVLALRVRSIGEAAGLEIAGHGGGFRPRKSGGRGSPVRFERDLASDGQGEAAA